ncbi:MAG: hypothetical protein BRC33_10320, partial [Cyanobacteria bacterium SW_9_44_58]
VASGRREKSSPRGKRRGCVRNSFPHLVSPVTGTKLRLCLVSPSMEDRARQSLLKLALEPEWEAKFEPNSYLFSTNLF